MSNEAVLWAIVGFICGYICSVIIKNQDAELESINKRTVNEPDMCALRPWAEPCDYCKIAEYDRKHYPNG